MSHGDYACGYRCIPMAETGAWSAIRLLPLVLTFGVAFLAVTLFAL